MNAKLTRKTLRWNKIPDSKLHLSYAVIFLLVESQIIVLKMTKEVNKSKKF